MVTEIIHDEVLRAIVVSSTYREPGIHFFTPTHFSQQLAFMSHSAGHVIEPHIHNRVDRQVHYTQEALFLRKGKLRVDFYGESSRYVESVVLNAGDIILLVSGGHGFEVLEDVEMIEIKQGPFVGEQDKTRFSAVQQSNLRLREK